MRVDWRGSDSWGCRGRLDLWISKPCEKDLVFGYGSRRWRAGLFVGGRCEREGER